MDVSAQLLSVAAAALVLVSWALYLKTIPDNKVPPMPIGSIATQVIAMGMATLALVEEATVPVAVPSGLTLLMGSLFLFLLTQRKTPIGNISIQVGDSLLPFTAINSDGSIFSSKSLANQRVLLKFFRGSW